MWRVLLFCWLIFRLMTGCLISLSALLFVGATYSYLRKVNHLPCCLRMYFLRLNAFFPIHLFSRLFFSPKSSNSFSSYSFCSFFEQPSSSLSFFAWL